MPGTVAEAQPWSDDRCIDGCLQQLACSCWHPEPICSGQQNHQSTRWRQPSPRVPHAGLFLDGLKDLSAGPYAGASFIAAGQAWKTGLFRCWGRYSSTQSQFSSMTFAGGTMQPLYEQAKLPRLPSIE